MPDDPSPPTETTLLNCPRCKRLWKHLEFVDIGRVKNLVVGRFLLAAVTGYCMDCGCKFQWNINESKLEEFAVTVGRVANYLAE
jgi:hypothetical protein